MLQIKDLETTVRLYYERLELSNSDIRAIFGNISSATVVRLKNQAREQMITDKSPIWNAQNVNTVSAYKAWHLDIDELEKRLLKLRKLGFATAQTEPSPRKEQPHVHTNHV